MRTRIKMCGTTRNEDALMAVRLGIDALGFIFTAKSPRYVEPEKAARIINRLPPFVSRVGVFVNSEIDRVKEVATVSGLTQVQLHGSETPDFCRELKNWNRSLGVCKAFLVGEGAEVPDFSLYGDHIDSVLLDTFVKGMDGGTGQVFDWKSIARMPIDKPLILAGGLNPDNVVEAIKTAAPYAIDINSGVEDRPGIKSHHLLNKLIANVRSVER